MFRPYCFCVFGVHLKINDQSKGYHHCHTTVTNWAISEVIQLRKRDCYTGTLRESLGYDGSLTPMLDPLETHSILHHQSILSKLQESTNLLVFP